MKTLAFEGYSDDTFGEYRTTMDDASNSANGKPIVFSVRSPSTGDGLFVWGLYANDDAPRSTPGCWVIGIQQLDEDVLLPLWPMYWRTAKSGYSPILEIDAPDDVVVKYESPGKEGR